MTGNWNNEQAYYRCRFPAEYALANRVDHPKTVYLREADVLGQVDNWLGTKFAPARLDATLAELAEQAASTTKTAAPRPRRPGPGSPTATARLPSTGRAWTPGATPW